MSIPTRDELCQKAKPRSELIPFPGLGPGVELKIRGWSFQQSSAIRDAALIKDQDGRVVDVNQDNDKLLSVVAALEEPRFTEADTGLIAEWGSAVIDDILTEAMRLSGRTADAFEELKAGLRQNPYMRRVYEICRTHFKRLPSEMGEITAEEFQTALAEIELEQEEALAQGLQQLEESQ